jgi:uncharacterized small protein (DUF1192 family)
MAMCRKVRRGNFMMLPPGVRCPMSRTCNPAGRALGTDYTCLVRRWKDQCLLLDLAARAITHENLRITMSNTLSLPELEDRIAILRDNIRQLVEQATGAAGGQNEERTADRIQQQTEELEKLIKDRDALKAK